MIVTYVKNVIEQEMNILENGTIWEVIDLAKRKYNIHASSKSKLYNQMCEKIKTRLDREGLSYDIVRPD